MKKPILTFEQYLNTKKHFTRQRIKDLKYTSTKKLIMKGYRNEEEIKESSKFMRNQLKEINQMLRYEKRFREDSQSNEEKKA